MKKITLLIIAILLILLFGTISFVSNKRFELNNVQKKNKEYEYYLERQIYGTEVVSLINKAVNENERNGISKDDRGYYVDNKTNSIKIELKMITIDKTYPMEEIYNNDITRFVKNFNLILFKCSNIEYHEKTGLVKKIVFEQLQK